MIFFVCEWYKAYKRVSCWTKFNRCSVLSAMIIEDRLSGVSNRGSVQNNRSFEYIGKPSKKVKNNPTRARVLIPKHVPQEQKRQKPWLTINGDSRFDPRSKGDNNNRGSTIRLSYRAEPQEGSHQPAALVFQYKRDIFSFKNDPSFSNSGSE